MPQRQILGAVGGGFEACRSEPKFSGGPLVLGHSLSNAFYAAKHPCGKEFWVLC
jgi:hypothetical protein